jgi:hypothetical protein
MGQYWCGRTRFFLHLVLSWVMAKHRLMVIPLAPCIGQNISPATAFFLHGRPAFVDALQMLRDDIE